MRQELQCCCGLLLVQENMNEKQEYIRLSYATSRENIKEGVKE